MRIDFFITALKDNFWRHWNNKKNYYNLCYTCYIKKPYIVYNIIILFLNTIYYISTKHRIAELSTVMIPDT